MKVRLLLLFILTHTFYLLSAQDSTPPQPAQVLLNSEKIRQKFGSYDIALIFNEPYGRISDLYSEKDGVKTTRTIAFVAYEEEMDEALSQEHLEIYQGGSIGEVFKKNGWKIIKIDEDIGELQYEEGENAAILSLMHLKAPVNLAAHAYQFTVEKNGQQYDFAFIIEVHHPEHIPYEELQRSILTFENKRMKLTERAYMWMEFKALLEERLRQR